MRRVICVALTLALTSFLPIASVAAAVTPLPKDAVLLVPGHGWGHGRGMGQWGARGMASGGSTYSQILTHYYSGVTIGTRSTAEDLRVLVEASNDVVITADDPFHVSWSTGGLIATSDSTYRFFRARWDGSVYRVEKSTSHTGPWTLVTTGNTWVVFTRGTKVLQLVFDSGTVRYYRGSMIARRSSLGGMYAINSLLLGEYLYAVVPREMPSSWPTEALKAQAVAARTYAAYKKDYQRSQGYAYDICATTSCQVYLGYASAPSPGATRTNLEAASTNAAADATAGKVVLYAGKPILAEYSSSTGGYSAPGSVPYQKAVPDPGDAGSPHHDWMARLTVAQIEARWPSLGRLADINVFDRNGYGDWGGRVDQLQLVGTSGTVTMSGHSLRNEFEWPGLSTGLRGNWFYPLVWKGEVVSAPSAVSVASGSTTTLTAQIRNTGSAWWAIGGTIRLLAASSRFHGPGWISSTKTVAITRNVSGSGMVAPGQIAEFKIPIDSSAVAPGTYTETFTAINDGTTSMTPSFSTSVHVLSGLTEDAATVLENGSFESSLAPWSGSGLASGDGRTTAVPRLGASALKLAGGTKSASQTVSFAGGRGRAFVLGGWNRGDSTSSSGGAVQLLATLRYTDGTTSTVPLSFSRASHAWAYDEVSFVASTTRTLAAITVKASVASQHGTSYFDGVRLIESPVPNPSFEDGLTGWKTSGFGSGDGLTTAASHDGQRSLQLGVGGIKSVYQTIPLSGRRSERFALSAYAKAVGDAGEAGALWVKVTFANTDGTTSSITTPVQREARDWIRQEAVLTAPKDFSSATLAVTSSNGGGTVYVDALRLVRTWTTNPSFEQSLNGWTPNGWDPGDGMTANDPREGTRAVALTGSGHQSLSQQVVLASGPGYRLLVGAWNRNASTSSSGGTIGLVVAFRNTDGTTTWKTANFPKTAHGWRYIEAVVVATRQFSRVDIYVTGNDQPGWAVFDAIIARTA